MIEMECARCPVSSTCPSRGASPTLHNEGVIKCQIVGGFGRDPVDRTILSFESMAIADRDGPCLTVAEVPHIGETGQIEFQLVKIFSQPVLSTREKTMVVTMSDLEPRSHN